MNPSLQLSTQPRHSSGRQSVISQKTTTKYQTLGNLKCKGHIHTLEKPTLRMSQKTQQTPQQRTQNARLAGPKINQGLPFISRCEVIFELNTNLGLEFKGCFFMQAHLAFKL